jgi:hypothetical protein
MNNSSWLFSKKSDLFILFLPVWLIWALAFLGDFEGKSLPIWGWVVFILILDVGHVWSTLFRSYLNQSDKILHRKKLIWIPIITFIALFTISTISLRLFWGAMAYLAVYHFMKQQYGFMMLYYMKEKVKPKKWLKDKWVLYIGMIYPVIFWHLDSTRSFQWFVKGDFISLPQEFIFTNYSLLNFLYFTILVSWIIQEIYIHNKAKSKPSWGKMLWITTTYLNWYIGIVFFNSDYIFSVTNVVAHGIPYFALVLNYKLKENQNDSPTIEKYELYFQLGIMLLAVFLLAFFEEYLWDVLVNREKQMVFEKFLPYFSMITDNHYILSAFTALLSLPQVVHYVLDGYIWKFNKENPKLKSIILSE